MQKLQKVHSPLPPEYPFSLYQLLTAPKIISKNETKL